ncbi:hypothetical protein [Flavobacterium sp.]|uniref:hypothetical protein n=1 Tax=Flavobacterium sp. TaxID=239 RepID=UPI0031CF08CA
MKSTLEQIDAIKRDGYSIDFSNVFNHAFENYKKIAIYSGVIMLILTLIFFGFFTILSAFYGNLQGLVDNYIKALGNTVSVEYLTIMGVITFITALFTPIGAGFLKAAECADIDEKINFSTVFTYYRPKYFFHLFSLAFILGFLSILLNYSLDSLGIFYLGAALSLFISYFTFFAIPLIVFGGLNVFEAIKSSIILVSKNPITIFGLFIVAYIGAMVGIFACVVGLFFTAVFSTSVTYAAYFSIFDNEEKRDPIDSIGRSDLE